MDEKFRGRVLFCKKCNACQASNPNGVMAPCVDCGCCVFVTPALAPWRCTDKDRKFLSSLRIEATATGLPFERSGS